MEISKKISDALKNNKAVIMHTDTVLGILALDEKTIVKIKKRENNSQKKIVKFIYSVDQLNDSIPKDLLNLLDKYWPGPLTINYKGCGYRIPNNEQILEVLKQIKVPIYASSANITCQPTIKNLKEARKIFHDISTEIEFIEIKNSSNKKYQASTVYDYDNKFLVREGPIKEKDIRKFLKI